MKNKECTKIYKRIILIVFSLLAFLLLILVNNNTYAAVDMTNYKGKLNNSTYYHVEQRDLWKNEYIYCIDPNRIVYEGDYKVSASFEVDSKNGKYATSERQGIQAWILANDGILGYSKYNLTTQTYEQYLKTSVGQHLMWMSLGTPCSRIPYKNFTYNGKTWKQWHYYDTDGNDQGYQGGSEEQETNGVRAWGTLPCSVEDEWSRIVGDPADSENNPGYLNLLNYFKKRTNIEKKNSDKIKVEYDISKTDLKGASYSYASEIFSNFDWGKDYIIIGPISFNAATGDWLKNIEIDYTKNGKKYYNQAPSINNDDIKAFEKVKSNGEYNGFDEVTKEDLLEIQVTITSHGYAGILDYGVIYGRDREPEIYLCIKKDAGITSIDNIKITVARGEIKAWWYELKLSGQQTLLYGDGNVTFENTNLNFKSEPLIPPVQVELNKVDTAGTAVEGAKFSIVYSNGLKGETKTVGKDGKITFSQIQPTSPDEFTATITETYTPAGYKPLDKSIVLTFTYDQNNAIWKVTKTSGPSEKVEIGTVSKDSKSGINKIPVTVENKSIIEKLTILKTSSVGVEAVVGAKFKLTLTNVTSIKGYQLPTTAGEKTIFVTTDEKGNIVLEDIEITDLSKNVTIEIEETEAPVGYKKIDGKITVTLKREGNTYTVSETKKDNTVIDDEFQAGKVTLTNHELILNIKDIPVMNLGGIVWAEDEKTGKAPTSSDIYGDGNSEEALGGITVRLLDKNDKVIATTKTAERDNTEVKYLNNTGKESTVYLNKGQYLFTKLDDGTNYITVGTDYKVEIDYDGIKYNALMNTDDRVLYTKNGKSKITSENDHGLADATKTISGTEIEAQSKTNGGYIIDYTLESNENTPDKAIYLKTSKDGQQAYVTAKSEKYLNKTEDWKSGWKNNNGVGEINLDNYAFDINFGLYVKRFDLNLGTDVDSAEVKINGQTSTYTYDQILDGMLNDDLEKMYRTTEGEVDYNLYLAYSDYNYRIDDYKVPEENGSIANNYDSDSEDQINQKIIDSTKGTSELQVYVTYILQINNQSTQHNAIVNKVKYSYDEGYEYVESDGNVKDIGNNVLEISGINVAAGEKKQITLTFKVRKNNDGTFFKEPSDTSKYTNKAEIVEYSTTEGRLVDADSAPGNTFLGENKPTDRREDDTDTANGIVITFKKEAERSISGKVFEDNEEKDAVNDVIVQLIELVEIDNKQYEYIWQETVAGSNTVKTTATSGYPGPTYNVSNEAGEYKFTERIIPGNYIVRFIYGDGRTYDITENTLKYNGEDYKSTYVNYDYNAEWYNDSKIEENLLLESPTSKAVDNEARRLKVMSYAVDVNGTKGAELAKLDGATNAAGLKEVLENTWMCAETLKIKMPVDADTQANTSDNTTVADGSNPTTTNTQFANVNFGLMERPKTKLVLEKHITGLTIKPVASGVNLIANATADISDILTAKEDDTIKLEGQQDGLIAIKSGRSNRGTWYLQTDTTELAQGADAYITYTYVIKNEGDEDYLSKDLITAYKENKGTIDNNSYQDYLGGLEGLVKGKIKAKGFTKGEYLSGFYYTGKTDTKNNFNPTSVLATVEELQETLNPKVSFVNSTTDFSKTDRDNKNYAYYDTDGNLQENNEDIKEIITSVKGTDKLQKDDNDTSRKLVVSVGLSASEIENGGVYDSYIAQVTHYTNAAGRRDQSTPANLAYVHSEDKNMNMESYKDSSGNMITGQKIEGDETQYFLYTVNDSGKVNVTHDIKFEKDKLIYKGVTYEKLNEEDEFWAETFRITKPTGEDKLTTVQIAIISVSALVILGVGIILIKKFVLKK